MTKPKAAIEYQGKKTALKARKKPRKPVSEFKKITRASLPFDMRDPNPSKDYGIHGIDIYFILQGPKGAVMVIQYFAFCARIRTTTTTCMSGSTAQKKIVSALTRLKFRLGVGVKIRPIEWTRAGARMVRAPV